MMIYVVKCTFFRHFFLTFNCDGSPFLGQLRQERVIYLKRKLYYPLFERSFKTGRIFAMKDSKQVLLVEVLFQLRGRHPISSLTLNALFKGFQMWYHLFLNFFAKVVKIEKRKTHLYDRT